tara:strand:- start:11574 stop:11825 length:252 start_codon:yes stop_codon:yes gene_type:complete
MSIERNVDDILSAADDSVSLINGVNAGSWEVSGMSQSEINDMVQRNVDHLNIVLAYEEVVADSRDKSSYTDAVSTGEAYIAAN